MEEDNNKDYIQFGPTSFKITRKVADIKAYALEHLNEIIANEFKFSGTPILEPINMARLKL